MDDYITYDRIVSLHIEVHIHQSVEGGALHYSECPDCTNAYAAHDMFSLTVAFENYSTRILASELLALECVRWTDVWRSDWKGESGQRATHVVRSTDQTTLVREDDKEIPADKMDPRNWPIWALNHAHPS